MADSERATEEQTMHRLLAAHRVAIVGLSDNPQRISNAIARFLISAGKEIVPVNPGESVILGLQSYPSLLALPMPVDLVNVFRRPEFCPQIVKDAIAIAAGGVWLQSGIVSPEAAKIAREAGLDFIQDRCIMVELSHA